MDPTRFDALARSITPSASRRTTMAGLLAGLAVALIPGQAMQARRRKRQGAGKTRGHGAPRAANDWVGIEKKRKKKKKKKPAPCASACTGARNCGSDDCGGSCGACTSPQTCGGGGAPGVCGSAGCIRNCQNANGTPRNCGDDGCGGSCGPCVGDNYECEPIFGFCGCRLDNDIAPCEGLCVNVRTSQEHCGRCNAGCVLNQLCCDARCTNPLRDNGNCGECGVVCPLPGDGGARYACCNGSCIEEDRCPGE